ncbi:MAG: hypothetical protein DRO40_11160, partial [Thermoprotei archaeon]
MANTIYLVEKAIDEWLTLGKEPDAREIWEIGKLLGITTKKKDIVLSRYNDVFGKFVSKNCVEVNGVKECIYSWNPRYYIKYFPVALHATGTVLLFKKPGEINVIAYPLHRAIDYGVKFGEMKLPESTDIPDLVTKRVDGWQITAYYDPILKKWCFATRYVLHNMYYERGKLVVEEFGTTINPFVETAEKIAEAMGLYNKFKGYEGWTFTFVLVGPEPAITKPPYPMPTRWEEYKLVLIAARKPDGMLLDYSKLKDEFSDILIVETVKPAKLEELVKQAESDFTTRSIFAWFIKDKETPLIIELKSKYYPEAMNLKYLGDAKSLMILLSEEMTNKVLELVKNTWIEKHISDVIKAYKKLVDKLISTLQSMSVNDIPILASKLEEVNPKLKGIQSELKKSLRTGNYKRLIKKLTAIISEGKYIDELPETLSKLCSKIIE